MKEKLSKSGLPKDEADWTVEDWRELWNGIERIKVRIAARHSAIKPDVEQIAHAVNESTGDDILSMVMDCKNGRITAGQLMDRVAARCDAFAAQARALPQPTPDAESLLDNATQVILVMPKERQTYEHYRAEVERLFAQARAPLVAELKHIAEADYREWDDGLATPLDFVKWAQSRARAALTGTEGPPPAA